MKIGRNDPCPCGTGKKYKKCCLIKKDRKPYETFDIFFGDKWINNKIGKAKPDGYKNLNPMNLAKLRLHPLIEAIIGTQIKLQRSKQAGGTPVNLGRNEAFQNLLHENLTILEPLLDIEDWKRRLRDQNEFPKAEYELVIAAGYKRMKYEIEFIPRSKKRTGEFYLKDQLGNQIVVECKKKDMTSPKQDKITNWWKEFQHFMLEKLKSLSKFYSISIYILQNPKQEEAKKAVNEISKLINYDFEGTQLILEDHYKVTLAKIKSREQYEEADKDSIFGVNRALVEKKTEKIKEPMKITGYAPDDLIKEKVESIIGTLGQAYRQLEDNKPNIVYLDINIPLMLPELSRKIMRQIPIAIKNKLSKDYSKISAIVLTDFKLWNNPGIIGVYVEENVLYNENAKNKIPQGFKVYGDKTNGISILQDVQNTIG
ncbi:hypothetical protein A2229_01505 [Candidatus Peregrinibacteria bacterium RIFOXYA2_FULL_33_7]|nr:MAG: hypothetical protein A2229_01505 [Candidatus Peregrinibacteria bacterium RIFOXYA2_FULL_33_7]